MNEKTPQRRPATFKLDDPGVILLDPDETGRPARGTVQITPESDPALLPVPVDAPLVAARRGFRWGTLFWGAVGGLVAVRHRLCPVTGHHLRAISNAICPQQPSEQQKHAFAVSPSGCDKSPLPSFIGPDYFT